MPIANVLTARIHLWKNSRCFCVPFCCTVLLMLYYKTCADLKGGSPPPLPPYESLIVIPGVWPWVQAAYPQNKQYN